MFRRVLFSLAVTRLNLPTTMIFQSFLVGVCRRVNRDERFFKCYFVTEIECALKIIT